jgi:transcriptional regulator with XRE-family HTH domain
MEGGEAATAMETNGAPDNGIGRRLKAARQRCGWSREALAFHSEISWSAIAQAESGRRRNLRPATLAALAGALGVTIDYLVTGRPASVPMLEHRTLLYGSDSEFVGTSARFLAEAIERSEAAIVVTSEGNAELLRNELGRDARLVEFAEQASWYRSPVAALARYRDYLKSSLDAGAPWVRVIGEPVWVGRSKSETRLWTRYEAMLNLVFSAEPATILCLYDTRTVGDEALNHARATHPQTVEGSALATSSEYADPIGLVLEA